MPTVASKERRHLGEMVPVVTVWSLVPRAARSRTAPITPVRGVVTERQNVFDEGSKRVSWFATRAVWVGEEAPSDSLSRHFADVRMPQTASPRLGRERVGLRVRTTSFRNTNVRASAFGVGTRNTDKCQLTLAPGQQVRIKEHRETSSQGDELFS